MENELQKVDKQENSYLTIIQSAVDKGTDIEQIEKLIELKERYDANEAKKAYHLAMAKFKENPIKITKDSKVDFTSQKGRTHYNYANLATVMEKVNIGLSACSLSASFETKQNGQVIVTCKITHALGHSEETTLAAPADQSGNKNSIQAIGSTVSYLQRYTLLSLCGLATHEQDNDAQSEPVEYITEKQQHEVRDLLILIETPPEKLCSHLGIETIEKMTKVHYGKAMVLVDETKKRKGIK